MRLRSRSGRRPREIRPKPGTPVPVRRPSSHDPSHHEQNQHPRNQVTRAARSRRNQVAAVATVATVAVVARASLHATRRGPCRQRDMRGIKTVRRRQLNLPFGAPRTWGGARKGAGRKPHGRPSMPHDTRPKVDPRYPVQVTIRATPGLPSLRSPRVFGALRRAIARASVDRFRVIHFSIQQDHGHFIVEGDEARRARGGMHGLAIRLALAVNRILGRKGQVVGDRYHARPLTTPRQGGADQHGLRAAQLPKAPAGARVHRPAQLGAILLRVAARARERRRDHRRPFGDGVARDVDGARRMEARGWSAAGRRAPRLGAARAPDLNRVCGCCPARAAAT
jgi:hypothetical protein